MPAVSDGRAGDQTWIAKLKTQFPVPGSEFPVRVLGSENQKRGETENSLGTRNSNPELGTRNLEPGTELAMSRTLKITLSYDGTRYVGWQRQASEESVQGLLEEAVARFEGNAVSAQGAGRTDAGVHALGQVASVQVTCDHPVEIMARGLNAWLPPDVRIIKVEDAAEHFHARFSARSKTYRYLLRNAPRVSPFERAYVWHVPGTLDVSAMQTAATVLVGTHDFSSFCSTGSNVRDGVRTVSRSIIHYIEADLVPYVPTRCWRTTSAQTGFCATWFARLSGRWLKSDKAGDRQPRWRSSWSAATARKRGRRPLRTACSSSPWTMIDCLRPRKIEVPARVA
jgi:tRNA pseudouridine38-40 synthase